MSDTNVPGVCTISEYSILQGGGDRKRYEKKNYPCICPTKTTEILKDFSKMFKEHGDPSGGSDCLQSLASTSSDIAMQWKVQFPEEGTDWANNDIMKVDQCFPCVNDGTYQDSEVQSEAVVCEQSESQVSCTSELICPPESEITDLCEQIPLPISPECMAKLCFAENLIISDYNNISSLGGECSLNSNSDNSDTDTLMSSDDCTIDEPVGGMCISISETDGNLVAYLSSNYSMYGKGACNEVVSIVDRNFYLVQEKNVEQLNCEDYHAEKSLQIIAELERNHFTVLRTEALNDFKQSGKRGHILVHWGGNLMPDGGQLILIRYLILLDYVGRVQTWTMNVDGELCQCVIDVTEKFTKLVNGHCSQVKQICRTIYCCDHTRQTSISYYLLTGHLIRHTWENCDYYLHMNPLSPIPPTFYKRNLADCWEKDMELLSLFLDFKEKRREEIKNNIRDQPEIKCLIRDYILNLLNTKPTDILDHTVQYFLNLASNDFK